MKPTSIELWKGRQKKSIKRRSAVKKYSRWYKRTHPKTRFKRSSVDEKASREYMPLSLEQGILSQIFGMMIEEKVRKSQGRRGS